MMTKRIGLEYLEVNQSQKEVTVNEAFNRLDLFVGLTVDNILSSPPSSASEGAAFLVGTNPTGAFSGKKNYIAHYLNGAYEFYAPIEGMSITGNTIISNFSTVHALTCWTCNISRATLCMSVTAQSNIQAAGLKRVAR